MDLSRLQSRFFNSILEEINSIDPTAISLDELADALLLAENHLTILTKLSSTQSGKNKELHEDTIKLNQKISIVTEERDSLLVKNSKKSSEYSDIVKQRDVIESAIVNIRTSNSTCQENIENFQYNLKTKGAEIVTKEKELKILLEELKSISDTQSMRGEMSQKSIQKPKQVSSFDMKPFPASSFSFNIGASKQNLSKDRVTINRSLNAGEKSSRSSNVSNNTSMILDSHSHLINYSINLLIISYHPRTLSAFI